MKQVKFIQQPLTLERFYEIYPYSETFGTARNKLYNKLLEAYKAYLLDFENKEYETLLTEYHKRYLFCQNKKEILELCERKLNTFEYRAYYHHFDNELALTKLRSQYKIIKRLLNKIKELNEWNPNTMEVSECEHYALNFFL